MTITIGVEIETTVRVSDMHTHGASRGGYHGGSPAPESAMPRYRRAGVGGYPAAWKIGYDGSVRSPGASRMPVEIVSPVIDATAEGFEHLYAAVSAIRDNLGGRTNSSCGTHVHVSFPVGDGAAFRRLCCLVANFERALYATTGTPSREMGAWCASLKRSASAESIRTFKPTQISSVRDAQAKTNAFGNRYRIINIKPILDGRFATVEFRLFSGTTNPDKVVAWARLAVALVEYAVNGRKALKWNSESDSSKYYKGSGRAELKRLFYRLGWIKGQNCPTRGYIEAIDSNPTRLPILSIEKCRETLYTLADKYDQRIGTV